MVVICDGLGHSPRLLNLAGDLLLHLLAEFIADGESSNYIKF